MIEPGIYSDMPNADYHAATDWLGSTQLKEYVPEFYSKPTGRDALDFGSALHARVLGTDEPIDVHDLASFRSKAGDAARAESDERGAIPILAADSERIDAMHKALREHPVASALLFDRPGRNEISIFARDFDGRKIKCRPDRLLDDGNIIDLKSTSEKPGGHNLARVTVNLGYDVSAAHYWDTCEQAGLDVAGFGLVFVSKNPPHHVAVAELSDDLLADGQAIRDLAFRRIDRATPAYQGAAGPLVLNRPFRRDIPA